MRNPNGPNIFPASIKKSVVYRKHIAKVSRYSLAVLVSFLLFSFIKFPQLMEFFKWPHLFGNRVENKQINLNKNWTKRRRYFEHIYSIPMLVFNIQTRYEFQMNATIFVCLTMIQPKLNISIAASQISNKFV